MQNCMICTRMTSLYGFQPSSVFFSQCKTATLGPDLQICIGPRVHLWFWAHITACLAPEKRLYGFQPSPVVLCMQNGDFSIWITSLHWSQPSSVILYAKQRLVDQHSSLYGYQTSPVVLCIQTSVISTRITSFYGFQPSSVVLYMKTATLGPDLQVCMGPRLHLWSWALITACLAQE